MVSGPFWNSIRSTLLYVRNTYLITSEKIRHIDIINVLKVILLDKWGREIGDCVSGYPGGKVGTDVKKPQCFRLGFIKCLSEMGEGPDSNFLRNLENIDTVGYMADLRIGHKTTLLRRAKIVLMLL